MTHDPESRTIRVDLWFGNRKQLAAIRTICSHIENMVTGVRLGYIYKMRFVYSHFPINVSVNSANTIEIRNFMGEKRVRKVPITGDVKAELTGTKDEIAISGNDLAEVSLACSQLQGMTNIRHKDLRKFLDGA